MAKQSLSGLLATNDMTVLALNQEVTNVLGTTGMMPPDIVATQMGMGGMMPMGGGMGNVAGMMMTKAGMGGGMMMGAAPGMYASNTVPLAHPGMGMAAMGGSLLRGSLGVPMGAAVVPQQLMGSNAITPMTMTGSLVAPFGGGMGMSIRW